MTQPVHYAFTLADTPLHALPSGALFWPGRGLLVVSDLHLGKSERLARRGGSLLPPYENRETLAKLAADLDATAARAVICLGDSFDDSAAACALNDPDRRMLAQLIAGRDWTWISGNHDPAPVNAGRAQQGHIHLFPLTFRHIASPDTPEVSGHYHPKSGLAGQARPCFLIDENRVVLPAYGTYTGGLWADDPVLMALMQPRAIAVLTGTTPRAIPQHRPTPATRPNARTRTTG